jgi:hypothetical protein
MLLLLSMLVILLPKSLKLSCSRYSRRLVPLLPSVYAVMLSHAGHWVMLMLTFTMSPMVTIIHILPFIPLIAHHPHTSRESHRAFELLSNPQQAMPHHVVSQRPCKEEVRSGEHIHQEPRSIHRQCCSLCHLL